jgi:nucleoid DNA-binding protein
MRRKRPNGHLSQVDLALILHELFDWPLDKVKRYPSEGVRVVKAILQTITEALHRGEDVYIRGFGKFTVKCPREEHILPNLILGGHEGQPIQSAIPVKIKGRKKVFFTPSIHLYAMVNPTDPSYHSRRAMKLWTDE